MARLIRPAGLVDYDAANAEMHVLAERRLAGETEDSLILLEHPPVYTAGRRWQPDHMVWTEERIAAAGAQLRFIDRGGSLTFHGPGQLVGYPVLDLGPRPDAMRFVRDLEEVVIRARPTSASLHRSDVKPACGRSEQDLRDRRPLMRCGSRCTGSRSTARPTFVVRRDRPRGSPAGVTSLTRLAGRVITVEEMAPLVAPRFEDVFGLRLDTSDETWPEGLIEALAANGAT